MISDKKNFIYGMRDGLPIAVGYFAVSFTLGIQARAAGLTALEATVMSLTNLTSAGEFAALTIIAEGGTYVSMLLSQLIINLRYMLMSFALSQKVRSESGIPARMLMSFGVTDEIFGISISRVGKISPFYNYGAMVLAIPGWTIGTTLGVVVGNILPESLVNALNLALYAMFIAIVMPTARDDKHVALISLAAIVMSFACTKLPVVCEISAGTRIILLTVVIAFAAALIFPVGKEAEDGA